MKYFTPELYLDFNSDDPNIADKADEAWEQAIAAYQRHLGAIRSQLPDELREFAEQENLHDAGYLGFIKAPIPNTAGELAVVGVERDDEVVLLVYVLSKEPSLSCPVSAAIFSDQEPQWLYDEIGTTDEGAFSHDILLSNGKVLSFAFVAFDLLRVRKDAFSFGPAATLAAATS